MDSCYDFNFIALNIECFVLHVCIHLINFVLPVKHADVKFLFSLAIRKLKLLYHCLYITNIKKQEVRDFEQEVRNRLNRKLETFN